MNRTSRSIAALCIAGAAVASPSEAHACGAFFCSTSPVDQQAEKVLFAVHDGQTDMVVEIKYTGSADDFAWLLPVENVPDVASLDTMPVTVLQGLNGRTGPRFLWPDNCASAERGFVDANASDGGAPPPSVPEDEVDVFFEVEVGNYEVAAIGSASGDAVTQWLLDNDYRINADTMQPYVDQYAAQGMKFVALKLQPDAGVDGIDPFKLTLPGETPTIPLKMTALAAEPEMGILAFIFADRRFEPAGEAREFEIEDSELRWRTDSWNWQPETNWTKLVAEKADALDGKGWVVEEAGPAAGLIDQIRNGGALDEQTQAGAEKLVEMVGDTSYFTRIYTRISPAEMSYDPTFKRSQKGDVAAERQLPYIEELCSVQPEPLPTDPCDFVSCGALGLCVVSEVSVDDARAMGTPVNSSEQQTVEVASCACAPGTTARTTFDPEGRVQVACQDQRFSFINPGDRDPDGQVMPDPCTGFDCGDNGSCVAMNMTPTCQCDQGFVARGWVDENNMREVRCMTPKGRIPEGFYNRRPDEMGMPAGVDVSVPPATGPTDQELAGGDVSTASASGGCSVGGDDRGHGALGLLFGALAGLALRRRRGRMAA